MPGLQQTLEGLKRGDYAGATQLSLRNAGLTEFPLEIGSLASSLQHLDLSGNKSISSLPDSLDYSQFTQLKIIFLAGCSFPTFPPQLARCPALSMIGFRNNDMKELAEGSLPPTLRWLILTGNLLTSLPNDIGKLDKLEKCMLAGNQLATLPASMLNCTNLTLLRLAANKFETLPEWLWTMPRLAFLAFGGNPCTAFTPTSLPSSSTTSDIPSSELVVGSLLGEGASGLIYSATWTPSSSPPKEVALKSFKSSTITSDGTPFDEMAAALLAGQHRNLVSVLGRVAEDPTSSSPTLGLVLELIPPTYSTLGLPPTFDSCTRDAFNPFPYTFGVEHARAIIGGIAKAALHVHANFTSHGDLYAHNILFSTTASDEDPGELGGHALLGDFGAATVYGEKHAFKEEIQRLEVRAFGFLVEDVVGLLQGVSEEDDEKVVKGWRELQKRCVVENVKDRPSFEEIVRLIYA